LRLVGNTLMLKSLYGDRGHFYHEVSVARGGVRDAEKGIDD
jgi:hypothetical protein